MNQTATHGLLLDALRRHRQSRAFTMIELLIVASIIPIITAGLIGLIVSLQDARGHIEARMLADERAARTLTRWREDVACAQRVELADDGAVLSIWRLDEEGQGALVRYGLDTEGVLVRADERLDASRPMALEALARDSQALVFTAVGAGFRMTWQIDYNDGIRKMTWPQTGYATPLAAEPKQ
jgi:prepilin-type N-terminal cleavage/methylation domain-containing protein